MYSQSRKSQKSSSKAVANSGRQEVGQDDSGLSNVSDTTAQLQKIADGHESVVQRKVFPPNPEHVTDGQVTEWNDLLDNWSDELDDDWVAARELEMHNEGFDFKKVYTTAVYKIKSTLTSKYEQDESDAAVDWSDMKTTLNGLAGTCDDKLIKIVWLGAKGGHNNDTWEVEGKFDKQKVMGAIALDTHSKGPGNKNLHPAQDDIKKAIQICNANLYELIKTVK